MNETRGFILFSLISAFLSFVLIVWNRSVLTSQRMARAFYILSLAFSLSALISTVLAVSGVLSLKGAWIIFFQVLVYRGWLVIGTGISSVVLMLACVFGLLRSRVKSKAVRSFVSSEYLLKGLCLSVSISFLAIEIGKLAHDAEMRQFFLGAGYPVWFLYLIIAAETLGAIALLISKAIVPAALGLTIIMLGAIHTHYRLKDPFSDSIEALHLLLILVCIIMVSLLRMKLRNGYAKRFDSER